MPRDARIDLRDPFRAASWQTRRMRTSLGVLLVLAGCGSTASRCGSEAGPHGDPTSDVAASSIRLPPRDGKLDYQLGGAYPPPAGVAIVVRDRKAPPVPGIYNICYVNGFQIQPDEAGTWTSRYPELILRDDAGRPVVDTTWNEMLIDVRAARRSAVAAIVGAWISECRIAGFDAVEIDNLDSYTRSGGRLVATDAVAMMTALSGAAHAAGLAIAHKNAVDLVAQRSVLGTDLAITEECNRYAECDEFRAGYDDRVLMIEYRREDFTAGCAAYPRLSIVLRDPKLVAPSDPAYVYDSC